MKKIIILSVLVALILTSENSSETKGSTFLEE